jgi:hypothetical protein
MVDQAAARLNNFVLCRDLLQDRIENSINELPTLFRAEDLYDFDHLIDGNLPWNVRKIKKFADAHAKNDLVDNCDPVEFPIIHL